MSLLAWESIEWKYTEFPKYNSENSKDTDLIQMTIFDVDVSQVHASVRYLLCQLLRSNDKCHDIY